MKTISLFFCLCFVLLTTAFSQVKTITGTVTDENGVPIPGVSVQVRGTTQGVAADNNGRFSIQASPGQVLLITGAGIDFKQVTVGESNNITVQTSRTIETGTEVVVTALGLRRTRNQLPYSAQQIDGDDVNQTRTNNLLNNISGKISGLEVRQNNTLGGSVNTVIRGAKSITGNNQALYVIDGVPFDNSNNNSSNQRTGRGGYDYGNAAADINPDDIASITVLKGAAASALYGSRGSNGVIVITTKKGRKGFNLAVNSGFGFGKINKETFVTYQKKYGAGYGAYYEDATGKFLFRDIDGNGTKDLVVPTSEDASYGARFDPNLMVYQWDAFDPRSPFFGKPRPWVAAANDPSTFFETSTSSNQSVLLDGANDKGSFKLGYTRNDDYGVLPNSKVIKNLANLGGTYGLTENLIMGAAINFANVEGLGRYGTGYDDKNLATNFRQWWQTNVDIKEQEAAYFRDRKNVTWNWADPSDLTPIYWDNPYFTRYENYQTDTRNRYFGNINLNYQATNWLNILGRVSTDTYDELQEERQALGSVTVSQYQRTNNSYNETNFDLIGTIEKDINPDLNFRALLGGNLRKQHIQTIYASTNGGLVVQRNYALSNSANSINPPEEHDLRKRVEGVFAGATFTWKDMLTLDGTIRRDRSSTLPEDNNTYYYPSVSTGFVFTKLLPSVSSWLSYGKLRANYAEVGNDAPFYTTKDAFSVVAPFGSNPQASVAGAKNNPELKPEKTSSYELGLEMEFFRKRAGFDLSYYEAKTFDQIIPVTVSTSTGFSSKYLNAGTMQNKGVELSLYGSPVRTSDFSWDVRVNWTRNRNKVIELFEGSDNLLLATFQGGISLNATLNQPYPTIRGTDFVYTNGQPTIGANGRYLTSTTSNEILGNANPDWIGGINNTLKYKNLALSWLVDIRQGGDVFSLDLYYGLATGLYPETAALNDLGNESRLTIANGGGVILPGVTADGKVNTIRVENSNFGIFGYRFNHPAKDFVYDASFVKLREVILSYSLPQSLVSSLKVFKGIDLSLIGRNLWIIHKNLPYSDPEESISSGNLQGYQGGAYPAVRTFAFNLKLGF